MNAAMLQKLSRYLQSAPPRSATFTGDLGSWIGAVSERRRLIVDAAAKGHTRREIAEACGVSEARISKILAEERM